MKLKGRAVWISDVHLGTNACQAEKLNSFLDALEVDKLYLVGDIIDFWKLKAGWSWKKSHTKVLRKILKFKEVIYIPGNHDEWFRDYCPIKFGNVQTVDSYEHVTKSGETLLVFHGDELDAFIRAHKWIAIIGSYMYDGLVYLNTTWRKIHKLITGNEPHFSLSLWLKHKAKEATNFMVQFEEEAVAHAQSKGADGAICGHIHNPVARYPYYNCGDWVENCSYLFEDNNGVITVNYWK